MSAQPAPAADDGVPTAAAGAVVGGEAATGCVVLDDVSEADLVALVREAGFGGESLAAGVDGQDDGAGGVDQVALTEALAAWISSSGDGPECAPPDAEEAGWALLPSGVGLPSGAGPLSGVGLPSEAGPPGAGPPAGEGTPPGAAAIFPAGFRRGHDRGWPGPGAPSLGRRRPAEDMHPSKADDHGQDPGLGWRDGGVLDRMPPGAALAGFLGRAAGDGLRSLDDDVLIGVLLGWHRLGSWAAAGELAAVSELVRRRHQQAETSGDDRWFQHVDDEVAAALRLTKHGANRLLEEAWDLERLPGTAAALAEGRIDRWKARVIGSETTGLDGGHAAAVEAAVLPRAAGQTPGELRMAARRAVLSADPAAVARRREKAERQARVETWAEDAGTAAIAGRDLPPGPALAADERINALAHELKDAGADGTLDQLRARAFLALLTGQPVPGPAGTGSPPVPGSAGTGIPGTSQGRGSRVPGGGGCATAGRAVHPSGAKPGFAAASAVGAASATGCGDGGIAGDDGGDGQESAGRGGHGPAGPAGWEFAGPVPGWVNLTLPLASLLGGSGEPGEVAGFGPVTAADARHIAEAIAGDPHSRWCVTITGPGGRAVAHGCAPGGPRRSRGPHGRGPGPPPPRPPGDRPGCPPPGSDGSRRPPPGVGSNVQWPPPDAGGNDPSPGRGRNGQRPPPGLGWQLAVTVRPLAVGDCDHARESAGYRPSPSLRHVIRIRQPRCSFPGCRRAAARCDEDHTVPYDQGGRTCECNLAPLCRRHHQAKQAPGWRLEQPRPGHMIWTSPAGRTYPRGLGT